MLNSGANPIKFRFQKWYQNEYLLDFCELEENFVVTAFLSVTICVIIRVLICVYDAFIFKSIISPCIIETPHNIGKRDSGNVLVSPFSLHVKKQFSLWL